MLVEAKQAFYNEKTGAVQPWRDIEVTDTLGNELVNEGLAEAIAEGGGGGGGDFKTANVTIVGDGGTFAIYTAKNDDNVYPCMLVTDDGFYIDIEVENGNEATATIVYPGDSTIILPDNIVKSVSGDAVYDNDTNTITVTGDCTITGYLDD